MELTEKIEELEAAKAMMHPEPGTIAEATDLFVPHPLKTLP